MIVAAMFAARKGYPVGVRVPFSEATRVFFRAIPSLMLLVIVIGGILAGLFTATEASAIAVLYALILSFIYKELTWAKLPQSVIAIGQDYGYRPSFGGDLYGLILDHEL